MRRGAARFALELDYCLLVLALAEMAAVVVVKLEGFGARVDVSCITSFLVGNHQSLPECGTPDETIVTQYLLLSCLLLHAKKICNVGSRAGAVSVLHFLVRLT